MNNIDLLKFITCGSVDDGKSTLIGRLLFESGFIYEDNLKALHQDSQRFGSQGQSLDLALLVDGLSAEREQGITIDVAYRYFSTKKRKFIVADTPGHEQYTRNMVTAASTASMAIILIDVRKGILSQTRRHAFIASLLGIKHIVLAINKFDLVDYEVKVFENLKNNFKSVSDYLNFKSLQFIPISALNGDNVIVKSNNMPWYEGPSLLQYLENFKLENNTNDPLRVPIQYVIREGQDFRGYAGRIVSGQMRKNQDVKIFPSGFETKIETILNFNKNLTIAETGKSVTFTLANQLDLSRGDILVDKNYPCEISDQFNIDLIWMDKKTFYPGRVYLIKMESRLLKAKIFIKYKYDIEKFKKLKSSKLMMNDIASCNISFLEPIVFECYEKNQVLGSMIIIDLETNLTCGAAKINFPLRRSSNIHLQKLSIDKKDRSKIKNQNPCVLWFTGLSGSGKSTIANLLEKKLYSLGAHTCVLDGDNIRLGLNKDLGFTEEDRVENIRRVGEVSKLMVEAGLITIVSFISPFLSEREMVRNLLKKDEFVEIFVDTTLELAEKRDPKGLYKKARSGELPNFTGIDSPYEKPKNPEIHLNTSELSAEKSAEIILDYLKSKELFFN